MSIVERFIKIINWPTSRKVVLITIVVLIAGVLQWIIGRLSLADTGIVDLALWDWVMGIWCGGFALTCLLALPAALAGRDARWTAYLGVLFYMIGASAAVMFFGSATTSFIAVLPAAILTVTLYYDERIGLFAYICCAVIFTISPFLEFLGVFTYAPILLERSIDEQRSSLWFFSIWIIFFPALTVGFLFSFLAVAARRLQDARLHEARAALERSNRLISRYVPTQLADKIISGEYYEDVEPERRKLTIFFSDVEGFTEASDELDAEELAKLLNEYLSEMMQIADLYGATVNQLVGDGIMIFLGAPTATNDRDHALRAVRMALDMQKRMAELREGWFKQGQQRPFRIRIGINTGYASVGDFGSIGRKLYSGIGLQTNVAARIQSKCQPGSVFISHTTWALVHENFECVDKGEVQCRGVHYPIRVYEVVVNRPGFLGDSKP